MCRYLAGEVIVIRYQHIAGCQSLYSYILTTRPTPEAHHEVHGDRIRMAARALVSSAGWLTLTLNHEVNPLSVLPLCSGSSPGMRGDAGGCQVAPESAPDAGRARIPPHPHHPIPLLGVELHSRSHFFLVLFRSFLAGVAVPSQLLCASACPSPHW